MFTKKCFTVRIAVLLLMVFGFNTLAAAAEQIQAKKLGPIASLEKAGKSMYFLTSLLDEKGNKLDPADNGKWPDGSFTLPDDAVEDKEGTFAFLAAINDSPTKAKGKKAQGFHKGTPLGCPPPTEKVIEKAITKEHDLFELTVTKTIKVGEVATFEKFSDGSAFYTVEVDQTTKGVTEFNQSDNTFTLTGKKVGRNIITVWVATDKKIRELINVDVVAAAPAAGTGSGTSAITIATWTVGGVIVLLMLLVLLVIFLVSKAKPRHTLGLFFRTDYPDEPVSTESTQHVAPTQAPPARDDDDRYERV